MVPKSNIQAPTTAPSVTDEDLAAIAEEAIVHPRTVLRALAGLRVRGTAGARVARVLARRAAASPSPRPSAA